MDIPVRFIPLFNNLAKNNKAELFYQKSTIIDRKKIIIYARILYKYSDKIILSSLYNYNIFKQLLKGQHNYDNDKLYLIPPPIDLELFKVPNQHSLSHQYRKSILYIGPLDFQRFPLELVFKAMNKLCDYDIKLTISIAPRFSDDFYRIKKIKTIIHSMGLTKRVHIIYKWLTPEEIAALYTRNMIAIFPFTSKIKNIVDPPLSLLEAMASGCIPIATKTLSIPLIVKDGYNGKLLDCLEPSQLAIKIKAVLESDIKKVQSNARKTIEKYFSPSRVRKLLIMLYKDRDS
jgi:glycosyltransferase involved in cell wall biosynthesis